MTEQTMIPTRNETASTSVALDKPTKKTKPSKRSKPSKKATAKTPKKNTPKSSSLIDEEKRLERNRRLREWRRAHAEQQRAYYAAWNAKRKRRQPKPIEQQPDQAEQMSGESPVDPPLSAAAQMRRAKAKKPARSKKPKKGGKA